VTANSGHSFSARVYITSIPSQSHPRVHQKGHSAPVGLNWSDSESVTSACTTHRTLATLV